MANQKATALTGFTPILTDIIYAVDDPGGTPISGKVTFQQAMDLMEASMTVPSSVSAAYRTSTILSSTSNAEGAALIGVEDAGTYFAGANVEAVLAEIGALLPAEANATADQSDAEIETAYNNQVAVIGQAEAEAGVATTVRRFTAERIGQAIAALAATDNFDEGAGAPASAPSAVNRFYRDTSGGDLYYSIGTSTTADWILLFSATGGSLLSELTDTDAVTTSDHALFGDATASGASKSRTYANLISDLALALTSGNTYAGTHDFGGADDLEIPNGATPTVDTAGQIAIDTTVTDFTAGVMIYYAGTDVMGTVAMPIAQFGTPTNGAVPTYNATTDYFEMSVPAGSGDVSKVGTPADGQIGVWTGDGTIEGDASLTFDTTDDTLVIAASGKLGFGAVDILSDSAGTTTLQNIDALDATTEATIEAAIDTLANLTSIQGHTVTLTGDFIRSGTHSLTLTTGATTNVTLPASGTLATLAGTETFTNKTLTDPKVSHSYNAQTGTTYTLVLADANKVVSMSNASANTLTIPTNASVAFPTGTIITVFALGAGTTTIAGDTGVTLSGNGGSGSAYSADIQTQYNAATIIKIGTDSWLISGDIDTVAA